MQVTLTPRQEEWVRLLMANGKFSTPMEVIERALHLLRKQTADSESLDSEVRSALLKAEDDIREGRFCTKSIDQIIDEARGRNS